MNLKYSEILVPVKYEKTFWSSSKNITKGRSSFCPSLFALEKMRNAAWTGHSWGISSSLVRWITSPFLLFFRILHLNLMTYKDLYDLTCLLTSFLFGPKKWNQTHLMLSVSFVSLELQSNLATSDLSEQIQTNFGQCIVLKNNQRLYSGKKMAH